jgi:hypothetical protein
MRIDKNRLILIAVAAVLVIALTVLLIIALGDLKDRKNDGPQQNTTPTVQAQDGEDIITVTPYGNLVFPGKWAHYVTVSRKENPDLTVSYTTNLPSGKVQKLFDIRFGEAMAPAVGQVVSSEGLAVGVHVTVHPFNPDGSWAVNEIDAVNEMLESLTKLLDGLNMIALGTPIPEIDGEAMSFNTPYCKLYLPKRWLEEIRVSVDESDGYEMVFSAVIGTHEPVKVFAVNFGGSEERGQVVCTLNTENDVVFAVRARIFDLETEGWGSVDRSTLVTVQEELNFLLEKLMQE